MSTANGLDWQTDARGSFVSTRSPVTDAPLIALFQQGLRETGFVDDRNVVIDYRWAEGQYDRLPALVADLVQRQVAVIVTIGGNPSALTAKAATARSYPFSYRFDARTRGRSPVR